MPKALPLKVSLTGRAFNLLGALLSSKLLQPNQHRPPGHNPPDTTLPDSTPPRHNPPGHRPPPPDTTPRTQFPQTQPQASRHRSSKPLQRESFADVLGAPETPLRKVTAGPQRAVNPGLGTDGLTS